MRYICLFLLVLISSPFYAQYSRPYSINYTTSDGLPNSCVYDIQEDSLGYIWFATNHGIAKYDGNKFYVFNDSLLNQPILKIYKDYKGCIWFIGRDCNLFFVDNQHIKQLQMKEHEFRKIKDQIISDFHVDKTGAIYLGFTQKMGMATIDTNGSIRRNTLSSDIGIFVYTIDNEPFHYESQHNVHDQNRFNYYINNTKHSFVRNEEGSIHVNTFKIDEHHLFVSQGKNLLLFEDDVLVWDTTLDKHIIFLEENERGVWVGFYKGGVKLFSFTNKRLVLQQHWFRNKSITRVFKDREEGYWVCSMEEGVFYIPNVEIRHYDAALGLSDNQIYSIEGNGEEEILVGYGNGNIDIIKKDSIRHLVHFSRQGINHAIYDILYDNETNGYWISDFFIHYYDSGGQISDIKGQSSVKKIVKTGNEIWSGSYGLVKVIDDSLHYSKYKGPLILGVGMDKQLLVGINDTVRVFDVQKEKLEKEIVGFGYAIFGIHEEKFALCHSNNGITVYTRKDTTYFSHLNGYNNGKITSIKEKDNQLIIASEKGVDIVSSGKEGYKTIHYGEDIGMMSDINCLYLGENNYWFGSNKGVFKIPFGSFEKKIIPCPFLKQIEAGEFVYENFAEKIEIPPLDNNIILSFDALTYKYKSQLQFGYKLKPLDDKYKLVSTKTLNYSNLAPGNYTFVLQVKLDDDGPTEEVAYHFTILSPWWKTWWFIFTEIIISVGIIVVIVSFLINRMKRKQLKELELKGLINSLTLNSIQAQFNPHFTFNSLNSVQSFILSEDTEKANYYLSKFSSLMRSILVNSKRKSILLDTEIKLLEDYMELEKMRLAIPFTSTIVVSDEIDSSFEYVPPMLLQPLIENAINHGIFNANYKCHINIEIRGNEKGLVIVIEDDGIGIISSKEINKKKRKGTGTGIELVKKRLSLLKYGEIKIVDLKEINTKDTGVRVILEFEIDD